MDDILSNNTKFRKCREYEDIYHTNIKVEGKVNYFIRKERKSGNITEDEYKQIYVSGSSPAIMYGLPKIHKDGVPLRPILAAFKAPSFSLAKFIVPILSPLSTNEHTLKNSYEFKELLDKMSFPIGSCLASFDVTSLFTNVPIEETIDIATNAIYEGGKSFRNMTLVFCNPNTIQGLTKHKEKLPGTLQSGVCYSYECDDCHAIYIGSSIRALRTRANEHFGRSSRSGNILTNPTASSIREHFISCKSKMSMDDFKVLETHSDPLALRIAESILIAESKPTLNQDLSAFPLMLI